MLRLRSVVVAGRVSRHQGIQRTSVPVLRQLQRSQRRTESTESASKSSSSSSRGGGAGGLFRTLLSTVFWSGLAIGGVVVYSYEDSAFRQQLLRILPGPVKPYLDHAHSTYAQVRTAATEAAEHAKRLGDKAQSMVNKAKEMVGGTAPKEEKPGTASTAAVAPISKPAAQSTVSATPAVPSKPPAVPVPVVVEPTVQFESLQDISNYLARTADRLQSLVQSLPESVPQRAQFVALLQHVNEHRAKIRKTFQDAAAKPAVVPVSVVATPAKAAPSTAQQNQKSIAEALQKQSQHFAEEMDRQVDAATKALTATLTKQWQEEKRTLEAGHRQQLEKKLEEQAQRIANSYDQQMAKQEQEIRLKYKNEVQRMVDVERAGRLAKLDHLALQVKVLEQLTVAYGERFEDSRRAHRIWAAMHAVLCKIDSAARGDGRTRVNFSRELSALAVFAQRDPFVRQLVASLPDDIGRTGIASMAELKEGFAEMEDCVREVSLVAAGGESLESYLLSFLGSKLLFRKHGLVDGDDVESILARARHHLLEENDVDMAAREINQLQGWAKSMASEWLQQARRRLEVQQSIAAMESHLALQSLKFI